MNVYSSFQNKAMSGFFPPQKFHSPSRFPSLFLSSQESFSCEALRARCVVICINSEPTQMIDGTEKPKIAMKFAKRAARYNEFACNDLALSSAVLAFLAITSIIA